MVGGILRFGVAELGDVLGLESFGGMGEVLGGLFGGGKLVGGGVSPEPLSVVAFVALLTSG